MATTVRDGKKTRITLNHGGTERKLYGTVRRFEQDGEERWELVNVTEDRSGHLDARGRPAYEDESNVVHHYEAVGFNPDQVVSAQADGE